MRILMSALQPGGGIRTFFRYIYSQPCFENCAFVLVAPDAAPREFISNHLPEGRIRVILAKLEYVSFVRQIHARLIGSNFQLVHSHRFTAGLSTELTSTGIDCSYLMSAQNVFLESQFEGLKTCTKLWLMRWLFKRVSALHMATNHAKVNLLSFFLGINALSPGRDHSSWPGWGASKLEGELRLNEIMPLIGFFG